MVEKKVEKYPKNTKIGDFIEEKGEMDIEREIFSSSKFWSGFDHSFSQMFKWHTLKKRSSAPCACIWYVHLIHFYIFKYTVSI